MKQLLALTGICALLICLALTSPLTRIRAIFPAASTARYASEGSSTGQTWSQLALPFLNTTTTFAPQDYARLIDLLSPTYTRTYVVEGVVMVEGYAPSLDQHVQVNGHKQNFQIARKRDCVLLGLPTILGGY